MSEERQVVGVTLRGRVQGVGMRAWIASAARARGLDGWVRNRRDGSVEAVFAGPPASVGAMIATCRDGPPSAEVTGLREETVTSPDPPKGFEQRATL